jgi:8-oxo-dGTP pyrophosphatase MutT (NUDIX family)
MEERSAGAVVFFEDGGPRDYLLLQNAGRWDFPKGNMEKGETVLQTVLREVREETALAELVMVPGFRHVIEYYYRRGGRLIHKRVVYLLARTYVKDVTISQEHQGFGWFGYEDALTRASYDNSKMTLSEAERFVNSAANLPLLGEVRTARADGAGTASRP